VNGGGHVQREYALGSGRADICGEYVWTDDGERAVQRFVVEIKVVGAHSSVKTTMEEGLEQIARYADRYDPEECHLIVVDQSDCSWEEKVYRREENVGGRVITVWGM